MRDIMDRLSTAVKDKVDKSSTAAAIRRKSRLSAEESEAIIEPGSPDCMASSEYDRRFCARTKAARIDRGLSQLEMATALGIKKDRYVKWENRSPMPPEFIEPFCAVASIDIEYLITGRRPKPQPQPPRFRNSRKVGKSPIVSRV